MATVSQEFLKDTPVLSLRDVVVFPYMVIPLFVGREKSIQALEAVVDSEEKKVILLTQKDPNDDSPDEKGLYQVGTVATILQMLKLPDGTIKVLVEGLQRVKLQKTVTNDPYMQIDAKILLTSGSDDEEIEVLSRSVLSEFERYVKLNKKIPLEIISSLKAITDGSRLSDTLSAHLTIKQEAKQKLLETLKLKERLRLLLKYMNEEIDLMQVEKKIRGRVERQMKKSQREYYLNEQMKAIQKELGELEESSSETDQLEAKITKSGAPKAVKEKCLSELNKLKMMAPMAAEATVIRNYLDTVLGLPWKKQSKLCKDLTKAEAVLEDEHYGLEKVKERIVEYLAVQQRVKKLKGPILCLVGPPGVGKTSLGRSIAHATGREYVRMSLGGVRDEAEIRGHRRTYIGALPGKIIQKISKAGKQNPLFLLDEIDKMAADFRGDPASALLEVLDPEQNSTFNDHYLEVDYDLSDVMFVATANSMDIPAPLLDRMEVIRLSGYTEDEKMNIASKHLLPKQKEANGLAADELDIHESAIRDIIRFYTREAGVRSLERELAKICRKVVKELLTSKAKKVKKKKLIVKDADLENYLGVKRYRYGVAEEKDQIGQVTGLAWTQVGGELLVIESTIMPGKGKMQYTGQLGEVMQESIQAALTVVRTRAPGFAIDEKFFEKHDIHVHVPEGATPKDGPSAGIGMCTALVSAICGIPVRADVAMTGEITLRGEVLPIGGLKEKLLAAHRGGIKHVIIPQENEKDLKEIPNNIKKDLKIHIVRWIDEVLTLALTDQPDKPRRKNDKVALNPSAAKKGKKIRSPRSSAH